MNQGKGAWKVTAVVLSIAQVAGFALATWYVRQQGETTMELKNLNTAIIQAQAKEREMDVTDHALATRIERIERKLFGQ
jgi:anti-sigma-K factor RskA